MSGHGGARPGAGRKRGKKDRTPLAAEAMAEFAGRQPDEIRPEIAAMSPLEVMIRAMAREANAGNWSVAADHAAKAAPYLHPRLANETHRIEHDFGAASAEDLLRELDQLRTAQGAGAAPGAAGKGASDGPGGVVH